MPMLSHQTNFLLCICMAVVIFLIVLWQSRKIKVFQQTEQVKLQSFEYHKLYVGLEACYNEIIYSPPEDMNISYAEAEKRRETKDALSQAKRNASVQDYSARVYLMAFINKTLQTQLGINETTIDQVFPFQNRKKLDPYIKFLTLMYVVMQERGTDTWTWLQEENHLSQLRENGRYEIYQSDIDMMFDKYVGKIPYTVKLDVLTQRLYEDKFGQGHVDLLSWQNIEDLAVGQGGIPTTATDISASHKKQGGTSIAGHDKVVILFRGINIHLRFIGMGSPRELERVCRHICLYKNPGELSEDVGYIENTLANGDRVVVYRDSFGDSWGFLIRKNNEGRLMTLQELYPASMQKHADKLWALLDGLMVGCQSTILSGEMYSGKTSLLRAMIDVSNPNYNYRGLESVFELNLRKHFPTRDIATFLEREDLPGDKVLEFLKRTNGTVLVLGEMLKEVSANWLISAGQSGFRYVLSTTHSITTESLIKWLLNAKLNTSGSSNADLVILDIINAIHFDVHCGLNILSGERFVERVTEIVPTGDDRLYQIVDIMVYDRENKEYIIKNPLSKRTLESIRTYADEEKYVSIASMFGGTAAIMP